MLKRTALFEEHQKLNGRLVDFGGWELPVQYSGVMAEHTAVRTACGLFDVSHMGEINVEGPGALAFVNSIITNDASTLEVDQAQYSAMCNAHGGIVDDLVIYRVGAEKYFLVVNASNTDKDFSHIEKAHQYFKSNSENNSVKIENASQKFSQIAIQGPNSERVLQRLTETTLKPTGARRAKFPA
jgi:aminomethyltransferase